MANMTYEQAQEQFESIFEDRSIVYKNVIYESGDKPIEGYRVFQTKDAAEIIGTTINPDSGNYEVYPGALLSVINDQNDKNNGLYQVLYTNGDPSSYKLNKIYDASTVDSLISSHSGSITIQSIDILNDMPIDDGEDGEPGERGESELMEQEGEDEAKLLYFVGTDSSISTQPDISTLYFTDTIAYDSTGTLFTRENLQSSDIRLKDNIKQLDIDLNTLSEIEKISFAWKATPNKKTIGVSAQSVEKIFPELVYENPTTGFKSVNYEALTAVALAAIDKLNDKVNTLESIITEMKQGK